MSVKMKALNNEELGLLVNQLQGHLDAKLQKCHHTNDGFVFEFYLQGRSIYWILDMDPQLPILLFDDNILVPLIKKKTPLELFLKTHFYGKRLSHICLSAEFQRVVDVNFGYDSPVQMQIRLFPHGQNILLYAENKKLSLLPAKELKVSDSGVKNNPARTLDKIKDEWFEQKKSKNPKKDNVIDLEKMIIKKNQTILSLKEQLEALDQVEWGRAGELLVQVQSLELPERFLKYLNTEKSFSWNIENVFSEAKKAKSKIAGLRQRISDLEIEISKIKNGEFIIKSTSASQKQKKTNWKGYRFSINNKVEVYVGRNATENLSIIRHAQSWDLWMHLKDYPGAHGIIRRPRNYEMTREELDQVARFIAKHSKKSSHFLNSGDIFEVLITESRYVRPIKGDKLGRVNYSNETVLSVRM